MKPMPKVEPVDVTRFWMHVQHGGPDECWIWDASRKRGGYGQFTISHFQKRHTVAAHRLAYYFSSGIDPLDKLVCHHCDTPECCNPKHLFLGTPADNSADCAAKKRTNTPCGLRHGSKTHPERVARGERAANSILTEPEVIEIRRLYAAGGISHREIGERFGVSREAIGLITRGEHWRHVEADGVPQVTLDPKRRGRPGEKNNSTRLNADQVLQIRALYAEGRSTYAELAKEFGVSSATIAFAVQRRTWKHLP
jgi:DNA-binding XRE family transcriptional regulator